MVTQAQPNFFAKAFAVIDESPRTHLEQYEQRYPDNAAATLFVALRSALFCWAFRNPMPKLRRCAAISVVFNQSPSGGALTSAK
jgi:hypothetical protein